MATHPEADAATLLLSTAIDGCSAPRPTVQQGLKTAGDVGLIYQPRGPGC